MNASRLLASFLSIALMWFGCTSSSTALAQDQEQLQLASQLNEQLAQAYRAGQYAEAIELGKRALAIWEEQLGTDHPNTATGLNNLALLYESLGRYEEAEPLYERALAISEEQLGADHPSTATSLNNLAGLYKALGRYEEAEPLHTRALTICEEQLGADHPDTAQSLNNLAGLYESMGRYEEAEPLYARALAIREEQLGADHPDTATSLNNLALLYESMGRYEEAEPLHTRALAICEEQLGADHPNTATGLNNLALLYESLGRYEEAEPLYERALAISEEQLGADHPSTATSLNNLAGLYKALGRYEEAEPLYARALAIYGEQLGADHPNTAQSLNNLAGLFESMGRYEEAEPLYERALTIKEEQLGSAHPSTAQSLNNLAGLYESMGRYEEAEPLYTRALAICEEQLGADHPDTATSLNNLALLYDSLGRYEEAEPLYARALAISEEQLGADHPDTATSLNNLAGLYDSLGRYEEAEPLLARALAIREEQLGADHPSTASSLNNLAALFESMGRYGEAEPLYARALAIHEEKLGADHPNTATSLNNLAGLYESMGRYEEAGQLGAKCTSIGTQNLRQTLSYFTEAECLAYAKTQQPYNLAGILEAPVLAARAQLQTKGLVMEAMGYRRRLEAELADDPLGLALLGEREKLAPTYQKRLLQEGEAAEATQELKQRITDLDKQINLRLQGASGEVLELVPPQIELEDVQTALPEGVRLLQGFRYYHRLKENPGFEQRYAWTAVGPKSVEPVFVALGGADPIEADIAQFRKLVQGLDAEVQAMPAGKRKQQLREVSHRLYQTLIAPLLPHLEKTNNVIFSLDAQLHFLPFGMLLDGTGEGAQTLVQKFHVRYVSSGRDLLWTARESRSGTPKDGLLVTNPAYDRELHDQQVASLGTLDPSKIGTALLSGYGEDTKSIRFRPTSGLVALQQILPGLFQSKNLDLHLLNGPEASETGLREAIANQRIVHLATHGFFLQELEVGNDDPGLQSISFGEERRGPVVVQDPMYRSGLALAGANDTLKSWSAYQAGGHLPDPSQDGMLLAAEAATLDLSETDVLFLGACETAVGDALDGEGIMGLRRALAIAGARNTILTLWSVQDQPTVEFTELFYTKYLDKMSAATALAETQKELYTKWLDQYGYAEAVNRAGAFICTSLGPVESMAGSPSGSTSSVKPWWKFW